MSNPDVFLALPTYDNTLSVRTMWGVLDAGGTVLKGERLHVAIGSIGSSLLAHGFNQLWCQGLCSKAKYFAMMHADIGPEPGWLATLIDELETHDADVMSVVIPIKSNEGRYSTAIGRNYGEPLYRMTRDDWHHLPDTFGAKELSALCGQDGDLLVNTGLWIARLDRPWNRQIWFEISTRIINDGENMHCGVVSEDWFFSYQLAELNCKVMATKKVNVLHQGTYMWSNAPTEQLTNVPSMAGEG